MKRLTHNKKISEMGMLEMALNSCYIGADGAARYRDFETNIDARDLARKLMTAFGQWEYGDDELVDDDSFDESMIELLSNEPTTIEGLISLFYRNLWVMAELREKLKYYEDLEEKGNTRKLEWIPCSEMLPEEHDSMFKKFKGTNKWCDAMFETISNNVNVTIEFENGKRTTITSHTTDGKWRCEKEYGLNRKVIAWMRLPEPYKEGVE